jgi:S1-C subfamily serine protease
VHATRCELTLEQCRARLAAARQRGWLGLEVDHSVPRQAIVAAVVADSPAARAGFAVGDELVALNGIPFREENEARLAALISGLEPGDRVVYAVRRAHAEQRLVAVMGRIPDHVYERWVEEHLADQHPDSAAGSH